MNQPLVAIEEIFNEALQRSSTHERDRYLDLACEGNANLKARIQRLLAAHPAVSNFLEAPAPDPGPTSATFSNCVGTLIGPYKLLEQIGEGGMGLVYMAEQQQPVRRLVALKLVKPGMDSKQVIARFEAERQALAMMDHPNIAKVHDAGTTETGRPYFSMELVRGIPINEFCNQQKLTVRQRLELFIQVCQAVQHAHQKGIIHRDLKPTNVLVTNADTVPLPKVIDFGIAKALGPALTDHTLHTGFSQLVGTPLYMSPEQAQMNHFGVDTRSDVYSLGVLLYELLTGTTPFDKETLSKAGLDEMRRMINEDEPPRPSARMSTIKAQALSTISQQRNIDPRRISDTLRGELDWIVMKAMEKDRSRRYESASALAADIQRYLTDEPVLACPPTPMYRFKKFARKHKASLTTAIAIAVCLLLGTTVSAWQAVRATTAEAQANANEQKAMANEKKANNERDEVKALAEKLAASEKQLHRTLYTAQINLAQHAWEKANVGRVRELLEQQRPKPGEPDLRGFEWNYLYRVCHAELLTLKGHTSQVMSVAFSPDGKRLATGSRGDEVKVWDAQTGKDFLTLQGPGRCVVFSSDGNRLAGAGDITDGVKVWDAHSGQEVLTLKGGGHGIGTTKVAFSPDGQFLATGGGGTDQADGSGVAGSAKIWDAKTGQKLLDFKQKGRDGIVYSPDGKRLAANVGDGLKVWDAQTGRELSSVNGRTGSSVVFSPDGRRLASGVKVFDAQTGQELLTLKGRSGSVQSVTYSPDGKRLAGGSEDDTVKVWDAQTGQEIRTLKVGGSYVVFSPDGRHLATSSEDNTVKVWDALKDQEHRTLKGGGSFVAFSSDGQRLATSSEVDTVKVLNAQTRQVLFTLKGHTAPLGCVAFSADGKRLATGAYGEKTPTGRSVGLETPTELKLWDAQTGQELLSLNVKPGGYLPSVAFSPDGKRLASTSGVPDQALQVRVWDAQTGQELLTLKGPRGGGPFPNVVYSPDGKRLASAGGGEVKMWDAQTGQELLSLKADGWGVAFSPDSKRLASVGKVWDAQTGEELLSLKGNAPGWLLTSVAYSPNGKRLASTSGMEVKMWDAQTGLELLTLDGVSNNQRLTFPNDHLLVSAGGGAARIWDATPLPEQP